MTDWGGAAVTTTVPTETRPKRPSASAYFILTVILLDSIGFGIVLPVMPTLVMTLGHVDLPTATRIGGWLGVVYAAVQFLSGPLVGNLGDRFGRRPVLLGALGGFTIDYLLLSFAPPLGREAKARVALPSPRSMACSAPSSFAKPWRWKTAGHSIGRAPTRSAPFAPCVSFTA